MKTRIALWTASLVLGLIFVQGCNKGDDSAKPDGQGRIAVEPQQAAPGSAIGSNAARSTIAKMGDLFKDAVLFEPPDGEQRPPDKTMAGKNVAALFEAIAGDDGQLGLWDQI